MNVLTLTDTDNFYKAKTQYDMFSTKITKRIGQVLKIIQNFHHLKYNEQWWFPDAQEGERGELPIKDICTPDGEIEIASTWEWALDLDGFPSKYLFVSDKEILLDLKKIKKQKELEEESNRLKIEKNKSLKKRIKKQAIAKLTSDERRALGIE